MAQYKIAYTVEAEGDFDSIIDYIAADNPRKAIEFVQMLRDWTRSMLQSNPEAGVRFLNARKITIDGYILLYEVDIQARTIVVLLIAQGARDWRAAVIDRMRP